MANKQWLCLTAIAVLGSGCSGGADGSSCTVVDDGAGTATITCEDGTTATVGSGTNGMDGTSCTVADDGMGTKTITCDDGTTVDVVDGVATPGDPGRNALVTSPGILMEVMEAGVDATTRIPYAVLRFTDIDGNPLDRQGVFTAGAVSASFTVAHLPPPVPRTAPLPDMVLPWENYITATVTATGGTDTATQPKTDTMGTWTDIDAEDGTYRYDFGAVLPADYSTTDTHRIGIYATRTFEGVRYVANAEPTFRPDGMAVTVTRDVVSNDGCNTCHSPLSAHGGSREDTDLCVTCHAPGMADPETGNTIDFRTMVHRIHRGAELPSVQAGETYEIIGYRGSVHDFSTIEFPQDIRNCQTCHTGTDGDRWNTNPSRAACGSCHDDVYFETGTPPQAWMFPHPGGVPVTDAMCTNCHVEGGLEPITEAHFTKFERPLAAEIAVTINAATLTTSRNLMLDFTVTVDGAPRNLSTSPLSSLSTIVAGPTTDYRFNASFNMTSTGTLAAVDAAAGHFTWTSPDTVDTIAANAMADALRTAPGIAAEGTWAMGIQATLRISGAATTTACTGTSTATCTAPAPEGGRWGCVSSFCTEQFDFAATNPVAYVAITDTTAVPRREVVEVANCNQCHQQLALHGGGRNNPELCVMCHNSTFDTADRMPVPTGGTATTHALSFANFVHRIHTGEHGESVATYWTPRSSSAPINSGGRELDFGEVRFPADRRACDRCHVSMSTAFALEPMLDLYAPRTRTIDDTRTILETFTRGAIASACTGCHDSEGAIAHAEIMTTAMGFEACTTCHAAGNAYGVDIVHARPEYDIR